MYKKAANSHSPGMALRMVVEKHCKDCGELRPASEFSADRSRRDGLSFYCKVHARRRLLRSKDARKGPPKSRHPREVAVPLGHKWCPDCATVKPIEEFVRNAGMPTGRGPYCKPCHNVRGKASLEKVGGSRTYHLKRRYGITAEEADLILQRQLGVCAICRSAPAAHVDHDHRTGAVRALLCFNCNGGLGQFRDDPILLRFAAAYVEQHRERQIADRERAFAEALAKAGNPDHGPPVGSQRGPEQPRGDRVTGRTSGSRRRKPVGEDDG
jgi:Recombination endonuclease VII